jgi:hypothetical protein
VPGGQNALQVLNSFQCSPHQFKKGRPAPLSCRKGHQPLLLKGGLPQTFKTPVISPVKCVFLNVWVRETGWKKWCGLF